MRFNKKISYPLLMALLMAFCLWIVTDIVYGIKMWELSASAWADRAKALFIIVIIFYISDFSFNSIAKYFFGKTEPRKSVYTLLEYFFTTIFTALLLNISLVIIILYVNRDDIKIQEFILINIAAIPIFMLYYLSIRNKIVYDKFISNKILLHKIEQDRIETELQVLKAQYHPHFLFNALNTIYFQIDPKNSEAIESVELLSNLLRYQLYNMDKEVDIQLEIDYITNYIKFQKLRVSKKSVISYSIDSNLKGIKIYPLLFMPLLENSFKHMGGKYTIELDMRLSNRSILFSLSNSIGDNNINSKKGGIGLENLKKRLEILYPKRYKLTIDRDSSRYSTKLIIDLR